MKTHKIKTLVVVKLLPGIAPPGLMVVGASRMSPAEYTTTCLSIILPKVLLFMALGYYFGHAYTAISAYIQNGTYFILLAVIVTLGVYYGYQKITKYISLRLETV